MEASLITDLILGHKTNFSLQVQKDPITTCIVSDHNTIKLKIHSK